MFEKLRAMCKAKNRLAGEKSLRVVFKEYKKNFLTYGGTLIEYWNYPQAYCLKVDKYF